MARDTQFGHFMRQRREALGLSLREFCRRNGLHAGDISKLERGLLSPPRTKATLESYAKALKLSPDSAEWNHFRELAHRGQALASPLLPLGRRHSPRSWGSQLEQWADRLDARATLPQLVRRLVHATVGQRSLRQVHMPAQEGVQRPGWDGLVLASEGNAFVPTGLSAWEMSVARKPQQKAEADFNKRTQDPGPVEAAQTAFVFVTLRRWPGKEDWCAEKRHAGPWQDVRAYDADTLEDWLEQAPAVDHWLAKLLGLPAEGAEGIDAYWLNCTESTEPHLAAEVYLASRGKNIEQFAEWYRAMPSVMAVETPSPHEALDFAAACYVAAGSEREDSLKDLDPHDMAARMLVVRDIKVWRTLCDSPNRLALIAAPELQLSPELLAETIRNGHHAFLAAHRFTGYQEDTKALARSYRHDLEQALRQSGADDKEAMAAAYHSGGSLAVLKRRLARFPETKQPEWSLPEHAADLVPLLLAGSWNPAWNADRQVIESLSGKPYEESEKTIRVWHDKPDSPFLKAPSAWHFVDHEYTWQWVSREDSWQLLAGRVTGKHVEAFEKIAVEALHDTDPRFDLPKEERPYAQLHGKNPIHSPQLRRGIVETLALLGCKSEGVSLDITEDPKGLAERLVSKTLLGASWQRWASLSSLLPVLAEASPDAFIGAVKADLGMAHPALAKLFTETDGETIFPDCLYAGLLRALETLAWHPQHLKGVSFLLARLDTFKTSDSCSSGPFNSLAEVFLPWKPSTTATVGERTKVLRRLAESHGELAWKLLLALMPNVRRISDRGGEPLWSSWPLDWTQRTTRGEYWEQVSACAQLMMDMAQDEDADKWIGLIKRLLSLPRDSQEGLLARLENLDAAAFSAQSRKGIVDAIRNLASRHQWKDEWAAALKRLVNLQRKFDPQDTVTRHLWLFAANVPDFFWRGDQSWEDKEKSAANAQASAIEEIYTEGGLNAILDLARQAARPDLVGDVYANGEFPEENAGDILPSLLTSAEEKEVQFAEGVAFARYKQRGWKWVTSLPLASWSPQQSGIFLASIGPEPRLWKLAGKLGAKAEAAFFRTTLPILNFSEFEAHDIEFFLLKILEQDRASMALEVVYWALMAKKMLGCSTIAKVLHGIVESQNSNGGEQLPAYRIEQVLQHMQKRDDLDPHELEGLEWRFVQMFSVPGETEAVALQKKLQREPAFFCELIEASFRSKSDMKPQDTLPDDRKNLARNAYELLSQWNRIPGADENGRIDAQALVDWVEKARGRCRESGRLSICDQLIGGMLAKQPETPGTSWPNEAVRDLIDEVDSADLALGLDIGIGNKRGVYAKSLEEGGAQEWALAKKYEGYAKDCELDWPVTAKALRRVAKSYEEQAKGEDERARARAWL